jgi:hypothetical protein
MKVYLIIYYNNETMDFSCEGVYKTYDEAKEEMKKLVASSKEINYVGENFKIIGSKLHLSNGFSPFKYYYKIEEKEIKK